MVKQISTENTSDLAKAGRLGDTHIAHVEDGEVIVPAGHLPPEAMEKIFSILRNAGVNPKDFMVDGDSDVNPKTGLQEFSWLSKAIKAVSKPQVIAPLIASIALPQFAPGLASSLGGSYGVGALTGGATGLLGGGGLTGGLTGALTGLGAAGVGQLGSGLYDMGSALSDGSTLGQAFSTGFPTASGLFSGTSSGASDLTSGGLLNTSTNNALLGTPSDISLGLANGDISALGNTSSAANALNVANAAGGASSSLSNALSTGSTLSAAANATSPAASAGGGSSAFSGLGLGSILTGASGLANAYSTSEAEKQLRQSQKENQAELAPYLQTGLEGNKLYQNLLTNPQTALANTPGYQFQLDQGQNALTNQLSAGGMLDSGAALKAAEQYGQGLAQTTYQNALNNAANAAGMGVNAQINGNASYNTALGNIGATATQAQTNNLLSSLGLLFGAKATGVL